MLTVTQYQRNLKHYYAYYTGAIDGIKGTGTRNAIIRFQRDYGLAVDGIYGTNTNAKLVSCIASLQAKLGVTQDGIVGTNTINAIKAVQRQYGLVVDGIAGTATFKALNNNIGNGSSTHFKKAEFACECGGRYCNGYPGGTTSSKLLSILEAIRSYYGKPITITSGQRCATFNAQVGGISNSAHRFGRAADIYIPGVTNTVAGRNAVVNLAYRYGAAYSYANTAQMGNAVHINV
nr:MAG TPA: peptidase [Caudoviricetes sp.]